MKPQPPVINNFNVITFYYLYFPVRYSSEIHFRIRQFWQDSILIGY